MNEDSFGYWRMDVVRCRSFPIMTPAVPDPPALRFPHSARRIALIYTARIQSAVPFQNSGRLTEVDKSTNLCSPT
jgi:hypothetical protein